MNPRIIPYTPGQPDLEIVVRLTVPGLHYWTDAPPRRSYLRTPHRHLFYITVATSVDHDNREVELHDLMELTRAAIPGHPATSDPTIRHFGSMSCEQIATEIARALVAALKRSVTVHVLEDNEAGAMVTL